MAERRGRRRRILALVGVVAISVVLTEGLVRWLLQPPGQWPAPEESPVMAADPIRGFALRPGATGRYTAGGRAAGIRINEQGVRDAPMPDAVSAPVRLLAVGDSFTFGLGVDAANTWPEQLERMLGERSADRVAVLNAGVPGYSARQMRQFVEALLPDLRPQVVVFGLNPETYWRVEAPYVYLAGQLVKTTALAQLTVRDDGLYYSEIVRWPWLHRLDLWLNQHFELGAHLLALAHRVYNGVRGDAAAPEPPGTPRPDSLDVGERLRPVLDEVARATALTRAAGARLVVLLINPQSADGSFAPVQFAYNAEVIRFCRTEGIPVVDPLPALVAGSAGEPVYRSPDDYHWTARADRVAADAVLRHLAAADAPSPPMTH